MAQLDNDKELISLDDKEISFVKDNYNNLHNAYWECHKVYWQMTSIFLPLVLTGGVLTLLKDTNNPMILFLTFLVLFFLLTFWFLITKFLESWNETRKKRLIVMEDYFNDMFPRRIAVDLEMGKTFQQYNLPYSKNHRNHFNKITKVFLRDSFSMLNLYLYILLQVFLESLLSSFLILSGISYFIG